MRFVLNARNPEAPAAVVCITGLAEQLEQLSHVAVVNDWVNWANYDVAIVMSGDLDLREIRKENPGIKIGLADPKPGSMRQTEEADFCLVSSIEQREAFLPWNRNQFIHYMIPKFNSYPVEHREKELYRIFYHGNKIHLNGSYGGLVPALNELGKKYRIEFNAIYNVRELGRWSMGRPDPSVCPTRDLQWYPDCYHEYLANADIGVVQNIIPWGNERLVRRLGLVSRRMLLESPMDHMVKFKSSANAGRAFVFGCFEIPVVADAVPSMCDAIIDGHSGRLVMTPEGWHDALEELILSPDRRRAYGRNFAQAIADRFAPTVSAKRLLRFIDALVPRARLKLMSDPPSVIAHRIREEGLRIVRGAEKFRNFKKHD